MVVNEENDEALTRPSKEKKEFYKQLEVSLISSSSALLYVQRSCHIL